MDISEAKKTISVEEIPLQKVDEYWSLHIRYLVENGIIFDEEDIAYFSGEEYRGIIEEHMAGGINRHHLVWFCRDGERIGAASFCVYRKECRRCLIFDFWVFPEYRGNGTGHRCYEALEAYTKAEGALYHELNSTKEDSVRFWKSIGFTENGKDEYDMPLFIKR